MAYGEICLEFADLIGVIFLTMIVVWFITYPKVLEDTDD